VRTLLRPLGVMLAAVLLLTACGDGGGLGGNAATVNGTDISRELLERIVESQMAGEGAPTEGEERDAMAAEVQRNVLSTLISIEIVADLAEEEGVEVTDEELDEAYEEQVALYEEQAATSGQDPDFTAFLDTIGLSEEEYRDLIVADVVRREALTAQYSEEVTDEAVREAYDEQAEPQVDARHILVETEEEADDAIARIEGGEDFAEVAADVSLDGSGEDGGNLGVAPPSRYVPEFAAAVTDAPLNELIGPVETQFGFHVIEVLENVEPAPFEEVEPQLRQQLQQAAEQDPELMALFEEAFTEAEVEVAPGLGEWDPTTGRVIDDSEPVGEPDDQPAGEVDPGGAPEGELPLGEPEGELPAEQPEGEQPEGEQPADE
jgi:parvulin-like peptidyl-prolyl isomerase